MNIPNFVTRKKKKKEKRGGHMIKCLLTELGRAGQENIWPSHSVNKYIFQNGRHLDILLFLLKLDLDASFKAKYSFEFAAQEQGIKG